MTLQKKVACPWHGDDEWSRSLHPQWKDFPFLCLYCHGELEYDVNVYFEKVDVPMAPVDWEFINDYQDDVYVHFACQCGDELSFSDAEVKICKCGRAYELRGPFLNVNNDHIGDTQYWIDKSNKDKS